MSTAQAGSSYSIGSACSVADGEVQSCSAGEGACPLVLDNCTGLTAPANGSLGDCPSDGTLPHGSSCNLACDTNYTLRGPRSCFDGAVGCAPPGIPNQHTSLLKQPWNPPSRFKRGALMQQSGLPHSPGDPKSYTSLGVLSELAC